MVKNIKTPDNLISYNSKNLKGKICPPPDKSISHRALLISSLAIGISKIQNLLESADILNTVKVLRLLGVRIEKNMDGHWIINGVGLNGYAEPKGLLDCGNSGTLARILIGAVSAHNIVASFCGDESLSKRPMDRIIIPLEKMGATFVVASGNTLPLTIKGTNDLLPIKYKSPVSSAQIKTSILLASLNVRGVTEFEEPFTSRDHTELLLKKFGANIKFNSPINEKNFISLEGGVNLKSCDIYVPADISSASFAIVAATITPGSHIKLNNVCINHFRTGILDALKRMGSNIIINKKNINNSEEELADIEVKYSKLKGIDLESTYSSRMIDEYPILSIAAATAFGKTIFRGLNELKVKESDRFKAILEGLKSCNIKVEHKENDIIIYGSAEEIKGGVKINSNYDHRIAMSFLILGGVSQKPIEVLGCKSILTSYPNFLKQMNSIGLDIKGNEQKK